MEQDGKTKEELLDGLLTSGVLTCDEYAKKLRIVQRGASSSEASKEPPANQNANFKTQSPNRPSETLPQRSLHGLAQRELEKRSHAVDAAIRKERQAAMKRPLETLRQVNLELRSCTKYIDKAGRNMLAAEQDLAQLDASLNSIQGAMKALTRALESPVVKRFDRQPK